MSLPHVCECRICGTTFPLGSPLGRTATEAALLYAARMGPFEPKTIMGNVPIVPTGTSGDSAYASSRADELAPRDVAPYAGLPTLPTCVHGYRRCMPCKFPPP